MTDRLAVEVVDLDPGRGAPRDARRRRHRRRRGARRGVRGRRPATGATRVVLDFAAVDYINSTGIALIVRLLAEARRDHREVIALGLSDHYREIFRITRLSDYLTIADATPAASVPEEAAR